MKRKSDNGFIPIEAKLGEWEKLSTKEQIKIENKIGDEGSYNIWSDYNGEEYFKKDLHRLLRGVDAKTDFCMGGSIIPKGELIFFNINYFNVGSEAYERINEDK